MIFNENDIIQILEVKIIIIDNISINIYPNLKTKSIVNINNMLINDKELEKEENIYYYINLYYYHKNYKY